MEFNRKFCLLARVHVLFLKFRNTNFHFLINDNVQLYRSYVQEPHTKLGHYSTYLRGREDETRPRPVAPTIWDRLGPQG